MRDTQGENGRAGQREESTTNRWKILIVGILLLFIVLTAHTRVEAMGELLPPITYQDNPPVPITCSNAVMTTAPKFLSTPKGSARYPFLMKCTSGERAGLMLFTWEGRWNPSETRQDRPNAVETLNIEGWEPFIPGRTGGKLFMYWTARCTEDPWIQGGTCHRYGGYVPDDLRDAFPNIDGRTFPLTENSISPSLRQQLVKDYQDAQRAFQRASMSTSNRQNLQAMKIQPQQQSQAMSSQRRQAQAMTVQPQATLPRTGLVGKPSTNLRLFSRGTDSPEQAQLETQDQQEASPDLAPSSVSSEGEGMNDEPAYPQVAIIFDQPLHFMSANGEDTLIATGVYEVEPLLDLQLSLAREGQSAVLLPAIQGTHSEAIQQPIALLVPGKSNDERHLVLLIPDGKRFDTVGSLSGVKSRGTGMVATLPDKFLKDAITQASAPPASEPPPPCQQNPVPSGPRWLPVPCTMSSIPETPTIPVP